VSKMELHVDNNWTGRYGNSYMAGTKGGGRVPQVPIEPMESQRLLSRFRVPWREGAH
jgi:hypothetical protein